MSTINHDGFVEIDCSPKPKRKPPKNFVTQVMENQDALGMEVAWKVWQMKLDNQTSREISEAMNLSLNVVNRLLMQCLTAFKEGMAESTQVVKEQDLQRTEILLAPLMKIASMDGVVMKRMVAGEAVEVSDASLPIKAAQAAVRVMEFRAKLLGIDAALEQNPNPNHAMSWLQGEMVRINQIVAAQPVELTIECEAEKLP